ncbi:MAG: divalent-cation tolerance protein CutA [Fibrobacterales bacterium]
MSIESINKEECVVVYSTTNSHENALELSKMLIEDAVAACVQIIPGVTSVYEWQGTVEQSTEYGLMIKTHKSALEAIKKIFNTLHPYDVPEFVVVLIDTMSEQYLEWFKKTMRRNGE